MRKYISFGCVLALLLAGNVACDRQKEAAQPSPQETASATTAEAPGAAPQNVAIKSGKVAETMNSGGYTYMQVDDGQEKVWIAVTQSEVAVGDEVSYYDGLVMENFNSPSLGREFDKVVFSNGLVGQGATITAPQGTVGSGPDSFTQALQQETGMAAAPGEGMPTGSKKAVVPLADIKVDKATGENSYTVSELYAKSADLNGKTVSVRGKVVKSLNKIMGKNWLHIQDGTGNEAERTHDLVVTTSLDLEADLDIVTVQGVLAANKDFGAGYVYAVIVEDATISKQ